jgi:hypothetical protein
VEAGSNTSTVTLQVEGGEAKGSLESETVKYGRESQGTRTQESLHWQGPAPCTKADPSYRPRGRPTKQDRNCQRVINGPQMGLDTKTYWLTVSRNVNMTLTSLVSYTNCKP